MKNIAIAVLNQIKQHNIFDTIKTNKTSKTIKTNKKNCTDTLQ